MTNNTPTAIVCVTNDLFTDNRVHKVCQTLQKNGYFTIAYGRLLSDSKPLHRSYFIERKKHYFNSGPLFYAEYNIRLFFYLLTNKFDIVIANDIDSLPAAYWASKARKCDIAFDAHELFSEVPELVKRKLTKKIWQRIEDFYIARVKKSYTVCQSIADFYNKKNGSDMKVIRNVPLFAKPANTNKLSFPGNKIILYQGAVNIGRGIEWVIDAMPMIRDAVFVIIGDGDIKTKLRQQVNNMQLNDKVIFLEKVPANELKDYTVCADLGLCLLENMGLNYYYSLPNRIFDFIQAGVPVLATRFPEIEKIVGTYKTGQLIDHYEPEYLAATINDILHNNTTACDFEQLAQKFCWENEEKILISLIQQKF